jgi:hypothetical protein
LSLNLDRGGDYKLTLRRCIIGDSPYILRSLLENFNEDQENVGTICMLVEWLNILELYPLFEVVEDEIENWEIV